MLKRYYYPYHRTVEKADHTTLWILVVVIVGVVLALTFGDAHGMPAAMPGI